MAEHMDGLTAENTDSKLQFFQGLISLINSSIGRKMDDTENRAIAFVVERKYQDGITPNVFLQETLGVGKDILGRDTALQIHNHVFEEKTGRIQELIIENPSDSDRLNGLKEMINIGHNKTLDSYRINPDYIPYIGGVSIDWVPEWYE